MKSQSCVKAALRIAGFSLSIAGLACAQMRAVDRPPVDAVSVVVTKFGPYPAVITHSDTPFVLKVVNRSGLIEDAYSLVPAGPQENTPGGVAAKHLLDLSSTKTRQHDHQAINLAPGDYLLQFQSHPDWAAKITITAE